MVDGLSIRPHISLDVRKGNSERRAVAIQPS
jgi:hypothetical protein